MAYAVKNEKLNSWVREVADLCKPDAIYWCDWSKGEYDRLMASNRDLHRALGAKEKVFIAIDGASHFMTWEKQRRVLHAASAAWLRSDGIEGRAEGIFRADYDGTITAEEDVA